MNKALLFILLLFVGPLFADDAAPSAGSYYRLAVSGIIDAATADYVVKGIELAEKNDRPVLLVMDTPGGLLKSTRVIVDKMLAAKVPVVTYVSPKGARAASAGTFILLASHVAAMAPGTNIGTASPIDFSGNKAAEKITNDSITYIKNIARMRGRSEKWAQEAITKNISSSEEDAVKLKAADVIAASEAELMKKIQGRKIGGTGGEARVLGAYDNPIEVKMAQKHRFLHYLSDPNIAYVLFIIGTYGLIYELAHPGALFPGVIGAISIVLAFIGFESLPINIAGIVLIVLAVLLFLAEAFTPAFGALFAGGVASMLVGSLLLFPSRQLGEAWAPSYLLIGVMVAVSAVILGFLLVLVVRSLRKKTLTGVKSLVGLKGTAVTAISNSGVANIGGEEWQAWADGEIAAREIVEVLEVNGMKIKVKKIERKKEE